MRILRLLALSIILIVPFSASAVSFSQVIGFGDSLSDTGNLFAATGGTIPDPGHYFNGRFQNGPSYIEPLAGGFGLSAQPAFLGGTNYAVGGARSRYHVSDLDPATGLPPALGTPPTPFSLLGQVDAYQTASGGVADPDALYVLWSGANDVTDILTVGMLIDEAAAQAYLVQSVSDTAAALGALIGSGARHLLVPNVPDVGLTPEIQAIPGAAPIATGVAMSYNDAIDAVLAGFAGVPGLDIVRFDSFSLLQQVVADPGAFGFLNGTDPCLVNFFVLPPATGSVSECANPDEYVFWDVFHPSASLQSVLASEMRRAVPEPATLALMGLGLVGFGFRRRRTTALT